MKKTYVLLTLVLIASAVAVIALHLLSARHTSSNNGFTRLFPPHIVNDGQTLDMRYNSYYLAGASPHRLYFGNSTAPRHLVSTSYALADTQHIQLSIQDTSQKFTNVRVQVDSPNFYMLDGIRPAMLHGTTNNWTASPKLADTLFFTLAVPLSPTSYAVRVARGSPPQYVLAKITQQAGIKLAPEVLVRQVDGLFCTDGMLHFNRENNTVVYLYYYRNEFICMDTSLNIRYRGKTIDTVSHAQIKVAQIKADRSVMLAAPPLVVNHKSSVSGNYLYVKSALRATNEPEEIFEMVSAIDVYDLRNGQYRYSFYLPNVGGRKLSSFHVEGETVIAFFGEHVYTYRLEGYNER
jgi:hypothetical protein